MPCSVAYHRDNLAESHGGAFSYERFEKGPAHAAPMRIGMDVDGVFDSEPVGTARAECAGIGVALYAGAVGSDERLEFTVIGQAVNFSAKLEKFNKELGSRALVTADVLKAAREQGYVPPHEPETLVATISGTDRETQIVRLY